MSLHVGGESPWASQIVPLILSLESDEVFKKEDLALLMRDCSI